MSSNAKNRRSQRSAGASKSGWQKTAGVFRDIGKVLEMVGKWIYRLRSVLLAIPVVVLALRFAKENMERLPEAVGINLLENGQYQMMVTRDVAVMGPLAVTAVCLLLMFCSRRVLYPWLISVFSLALPWLIWAINLFSV